MTEAQFKAAYITQFLASYAASTYGRDCAEGHPGEPYNHQPVEDAEFLANCAWTQLTKLDNSTIFDLKPHNLSS